MNLAVEQRLQHRGDDHLVVGIESANDFGNGQGLIARRFAFRRQVQLAHSRIDGMQPAARGAGGGDGFHF